MINEFFIDKVANEKEFRVKSGEMISYNQCKAAEYYTRTKITLFHFTPKYNTNVAAWHCIQKSQ